MAKRSLCAGLGRWYGLVGGGSRGKRGRARSMYACNWSSGFRQIDTCWTSSCVVHTSLIALSLSVLREIYSVLVQLEGEPCLCSMLVVSFCANPGRAVGGLWCEVWNVSGLGLARMTFIIMWQTWGNLMLEHVLEQKLEIPYTYEEGNCAMIK